MKHEFTDSEITVAADHAVDTTSYYRTIPIDYHQAFLDALPEPEQDDFQRGGAILDTDDVRKGDRVLIWNLADNLYEVTVTAIDERAIIWKGSSITKSSIDRIYLMDRPVVHPDPAEHPVILVTEYDVAGNIIECEPTPFFAHDGVYKNDSYAHRPDDVLSWSPAKVVKDNENS